MHGPALPVLSTISLLCIYNNVFLNFNLFSSLVLFQSFEEESWYASEGDATALVAGWPQAVSSQLDLSRQLSVRDLNSNNVFGLLGVFLGSNRLSP